MALIEPMISNRDGGSRRRILITLFADLYAWSRGALGVGSGFG